MSCICICICGECVRQHGSKLLECSWDSVVSESEVQGPAHLPQYTVERTEWLVQYGIVQHSRCHDKRWEDLDNVTRPIYIRLDSIRLHYTERHERRGEERSCNNLIPDHRKEGNKKERRGEGNGGKELDRKWKGIIKAKKRKERVEKVMDKDKLENGTGKKRMRKDGTENKRWKGRKGEECRREEREGQ